MGDIRSDSVSMIHRLRTHMVMLRYADEISICSQDAGRIIVLNTHASIAVDVVPILNLLLLYGEG